MHAHSDHSSVSVCLCVCLLGFYLRQVSIYVFLPDDHFHFNCAMGVVIIAYSLAVHTVCYLATVEYTGMYLY